MTEDEAKRLVCCGPQMVATAMAFTAPTGTVELLPTAGRCIASACMAWRGGDEEVVVRIAYEEVAKWQRAGYRVSLSTPDDGTYIARRGRPGYCGLAGPPNPTPSP